jgi:hypothetical protein
MLGDATLENLSVLFVLMALALVWILLWHPVKEWWERRTRGPK